MNSVLNSDYKQCTESKLGWVHSKHTQAPWLCAHCAQATNTPRVGRRVVACRTSYRGHVVGRLSPLGRCVVAHGRRVVAHGRRVAGPPVVIQNCIVTLKPMLRAHSTVSHAHAAVSQHCLLLYRDPKGRPSVMIQKLYRDPKPMPRALRAVSSAPAPYRKALGVVS